MPSYGGDDVYKEQAGPVETAGKDHEHKQASESAVARIN